MNTGKQSVKKGIWYIGGAKKKEKKTTTTIKKQKGERFPLALLTSVGVLILSEIAKPIFKKIIGRARIRRKRILWW